MNKSRGTIIRQITGVTIAVIGCAGLFLPVLQGWLLIIAGLLLLFPENNRVGRLIRSRIRRKEDALIARLQQRREMQTVRRTF